MTALLLAYVFHVNYSRIFLYLLPPLYFFGGDDPATPHGLEAVLIFVFVFGGSFVLYGLLGVLLGLIVRFGLSFRSPN